MLARLGGGIGWRKHERLITLRLEPADQPRAEIDDVPATVGGEDNPARGGRHLAQALSSWNVGIATSNAVPSSSTIR